MPEWLTIGNAWAIWTSLVTLASAIAMATPSTKDNEYLQRVLDIVNKLGLNVKRAKNADDWRPK